MNRGVVSILALALGLGGVVGCAEQGQDDGGSVSEETNPEEGLAQDVPKGPSTAPGSEALGIPDDNSETSESDVTRESDVSAVVTGQKRFRNANSGLCMGVTGASRSTGALIQQFACDGRVNQKWRAFGEFGVQNVNSGLCMGTTNVGLGANIAQFPCDAGAGKRWNVGFYSDGSIDWRNLSSGFCIGVNGASRSPGAQLKQFPCDNRLNQHWFGEPQ
jgi:hypothetical protein